MELRVLKYFLVVAREENITKAAALLHVTQPTLSRQLMGLEEELGVKLFRRGKYHVALTDDGMLLRRRAEVPLFDNDAEDSAFLEQQVLGSVLAEYIRTLSPPDGEIFLRHYLLLETAAEIGVRYGMTESAVRSRLHRIRKFLQKEVPL